MSCVCPLPKSPVSNRCPQASSPLARQPPPRAAGGDTPPHGSTAAPGRGGGRSRCHFVPPPRRLPAPWRHSPPARRGAPSHPHPPGGSAPGPNRRCPPRSPRAAPHRLPLLPTHKAGIPRGRAGSHRHRGPLPRHRAGPGRTAAAPPPTSPPPQPARLLPPRSTYRAAAAAGPARRSGGGCGADAEAPGSPRHPFVFELTPACRDSASPPDRAAGPFNNRRTAYPAAPARPAPPSPIGWTPPGVGAAPSVHWPPPAAQPRRPLPVLKLP